MSEGYLANRRELRRRRSLRKKQSELRWATHKDHHVSERFIKSRIRELWKERLSSLQRVNPFYEKVMDERCIVTQDESIAMKIASIYGEEL